MGRGCRSGPGPAIDSAPVGGVAAGRACWNEGEGSGEGTCAPTAGWFDGRMLSAGEVGTGGGGIELEARREWDADPGRVLMSGIAAVRLPMSWSHDSGGFQRRNRLKARVTFPLTVTF